MTNVIKTGKSTNISFKQAYLMFTRFLNILTNT